MGSRKRRLGDRADGRRLRSIDPFFSIIPYLLKTRAGSQNLFDEKIDLTEVDAFMKAKRGEGVRNIRLLHIIIAALVRVYSQKPGVNRFISGQRLYARNGISISIAIKKEMREDSEETTIKIDFDPKDTLYDVAEKVNKAIMENKGVESTNDTDKFTKVVMFCPRFLIKFVVWFFLTMDYYGMLPKFVSRISPFHASAFITDLGSLGIQPVYHHLYEVGTNSVFIAFGAKKKEKYIDKDNNIVERKYLDIKISGDERIVDGHYYANAFKLFKKLVEHPERLEVPPENVVEDVE
jgi:hypothetical protein